MKRKNRMPKGIRTASKANRGRSPVEEWLEGETLLTPQEVGLACGVSEEAVAKLGLPSFDVGDGKKRYDPLTIAAFMKSRSTPTDQTALGMYLHSLDRLGPMSSTRLSRILRLPVQQTYDLFETLPTPRMRWLNVGALLAGRRSTFASSARKTHVR